LLLLKRNRYTAGKVCNRTEFRIKPVFFQDKNSLISLWRKTVFTILIQQKKTNAAGITECLAVDLFLCYTAFMIQLVAFLGNYGSEYAETRHNTSWQFESSLPFASKLNWQSKFKGNYATVDITQFAEWAREYKLYTKKDGSTVPVPEGALSKLYFLKPETYMNASGESIIELASFFKLKPENILVVHDELELPVGTVSLKWSGGLGGHNGLRSTNTVLGTSDFWRIRFGIGRPDNREIADYVLSKFTEDERIMLSQTFPQAAVLLAQVLLSPDPERLIPEWGKKKLSAD
jgi:peptidyl-tRNA hydrolase, PTH1 family